MSANNIQFTHIEIQIAVYLFKHYKERHNPRQLAKLLNINHAHANKLCNVLATKKLLIKEEIGNSLYFTYNYADDLAIHFMNYILSLEEFPQWLAVLLYNLKKFNTYIHFGLIFGSSIHKKEFNDIDVLLVYDSIHSKEIKKIKDDIRKAGIVEKPIRYMDITKGDILSNKDDAVFYSIMSNNLIFYNTENYVEAIRKCHKLKNI